MVPCDVQISSARLHILGYMTAAILEDREWRNLESAPGFFNRIMDPDLHASGPCTSLDAAGKIKAPDISRIGCNWYKRFLPQYPAKRSKWEGLRSQPLA